MKDREAPLSFFYFIFARIGALYDIQCAVRSDKLLLPVGFFCVHAQTGSIVYGQYAYARYDTVRINARHQSDLAAVA